MAGSSAGAVNNICHIPTNSGSLGIIKVDCGHAQGENDQAAAENVEDYRIEHFQGNQAFSLPVPLRPYLRPYY